LNNASITNTAAAKQEKATENVPVPYFHCNNLPAQKICYQKLVQQIKQKPSIPNILLVGPGCAWLATQLCRYTDKVVIAVNLSASEIKDAKKEYEMFMNLQLSTQSIDGKLLSDKQFELVVFCSSIEYFFSIGNILKKALKHLSLAGEIHICGSTFNESKNNISKRSKSIKQYFPHTINELRAFQYKILHEPAAFINKFSLTKNPFHHIVIKNYYL